MSDPIIEVRPGQSVTLTAQFTFNGTPPATPPGPVSWSHNASALPGVLANVTPAADGMSCVLYISGASTGTGTFSVTCTSGSLSASRIINCVIPVANGIIINAGPVVDGPNG